VFYRIVKNHLGYRKIVPTLSILLLIILSGIAMNYLDFPWGSQPIHLFMAAVLFGLQAYLLLEFRRAHSTAKSS
jgi:cytochrome c oxidase assembly protein subunit 15